MLPCHDVTLLMHDHYRCEKHIHVTTSDVLNARPYFLMSMQSIFVLKDDFRSMQVKQEGKFAVSISM